MFLITHVLLFRKVRDYAFQSISSPLLLINQMMYIYGPISTWRPASSG